MRIWLCAIVLLSLWGCRQEVARQPLGDSFEALTGKDRPTWKYIQTPEDFAHLRLFETIYNAGKQYLEAPGADVRVPRVIHFIWLGPNAFPLTSIENMRTWMGKHPEWTFNFWTDRPRALPLPGMRMRRIEELTFDKLKFCFEDSDNFGEKSDVLRYEILYQEGGVYVDHDVKCFQAFDVLNRAYDFYCGIDMPYTSNLPSCIFTTNNLIGVAPHHPILRRCIDLLAAQWQQIGESYPGTTRDEMVNRVHHRTFWLFGEAVKAQHNTEGHRDIVFPAYYFDAPDEQLALFARHQYAGVWHASETAFEQMVRKRLMLLSKKSNLMLLIVGVISTLNLAGFTLLFFQMRKKTRKSASFD